MIKRLLNPSKSNSFFLFGARATGKSYWLEQFFKEDKVLVFDLLDSELENLFLIRPGEFKAQIESALENNPTLEWVIIDEVQKCPALLNYVHYYIEKKKLKFALSGSSARRLKQKGVNLLAGRAFMEHLFPLTFIELDILFDLQNILSFGSLPKLLELKTTQEKCDYLKSYSHTYIQNEIIAEQWVRNIVPFRKFLPIAAQMNTKILNLSKIAADLDVDWTTVNNYFDILEDTLLGIRLESYHASIRKRQRQSPKFYFFDLGICRSIQNALHSPPVAGTSDYGDLFEHLVVIEIYRLNVLLKKNYQLSYLRTQNDVEIDLILERKGDPVILIEIKSKISVGPDDVKNLTGLQAEFKTKEMYLLSNDPHAKFFSDVEALPWRKGIKKIFNC
jgi:predicted AAA+ superfamily ATPase